MIKAINNLNLERKIQSKICNYLLLLEQREGFNGSLINVSSLLLQPENEMRKPGDRGVSDTEK